MEVTVSAERDTPDLASFAKEDSLVVSAYQGAEEAREFFHQTLHTKLCEQAEGHGTSCSLLCKLVCLDVTS